jgi:hypothetical protein
MLRQPLEKLGLQAALLLQVNALGGCARVSRRISRWPWRCCAVRAGRRGAPSNASVASSSEAFCGGGAGCPAHQASFPRVASVTRPTLTGSTRVHAKRHGAPPLWSLRTRACVRPGGSERRTLLPTPVRSCAAEPAAPPSLCGRCSAPGAPVVACRVDPAQAHARFASPHAPVCAGCSHCVALERLFQ